MATATQAGADASAGECSMTSISSRRTAIQTLGLGFAASAIGLVIERTAGAQAALSPGLTPRDAGQLNALMQRLAKAPRRRDFKTAPMILTNPEQWDHEALSEVLAYKPMPIHFMLTILLGLSIIKAALIVAYFMHLKFERLSLILTIVPMLVICICLFFVFFPDSFRSAGLRYEFKETPPAAEEH